MIIFCCLLYLFISSFNSKIKDISAKSMTQYVAISYLAYCDSLNWNDIPLELPPLKLSNVEQDKQTGELLDVWKKSMNKLHKNGMAARSSAVILICSGQRLCFRAGTKQKRCKKQRHSLTNVKPCRCFYCFSAADAALRPACLFRPQQRPKPP